MTAFIGRFTLLLATIPAPSAMPPGLVVSIVGLPDGTTWTLGRKAVGRPFLVQILLANEGDGPIRLWDPKSTEGMGCPSVVLTDSAGKATVLKPVPMPRAGGVPTFVTLDPGKTLILELELLRLVGPMSLAPGRYTLTAIYQNRFESSGQVANVWTGKIQGELKRITVVLPEA